MATIKQATERAIQFALDALGPGRTNDQRLEEVESGMVGGEDVWFITLSMVDFDVPENSVGALLTSLHPKRDYKVFTVRKKDGEVLSMKIREFAAA
jgi:hypothetical protein